MKKEFEQKIAETTFEALKEAQTTEEEAHVLQSTLKILKDKNKMSHADGILFALKDLFDKERGVVKAHITVQTRLSDEEKIGLRNMLKQKYNASDVVLIEKVDERILGGIRIKVGEEVYDATIKSKLAGLGLALENTK